MEKRKVRERRGFQVSTYPSWHQGQQPAFRALACAPFLIWLVWEHKPPSSLGANKRGSSAESALRCGKLPTFISFYYWLCVSLAPFSHSGDFMDWDAASTFPRAGAGSSPGIPGNFQGCLDSSSQRHRAVFALPSPVQTEGRAPPTQSSCEGCSNPHHRLARSFSIRAPPSPSRRASTHPHCLSLLHFCGCCAVWSLPPCPSGGAHCSPQSLTGICSGRKACVCVRETAT